MGRRLRVIVTALDASELFALQRFFLNYVNFTLIKKNNLKGAGVRGSWPGDDGGSCQEASRRDVTRGLEVKGRPGWEAGVRPESRAEFRGLGAGCGERPRGHGQPAALGARERSEEKPWERLAAQHPRRAPGRAPLRVGHGGLST